MHASMTRTAMTPAPPWRQAQFDVAEARRAVAYLAPVVREAHEAYRTILESRSLLAGAAGGHPQPEIERRRNDALTRLDAACDECNAVGADLIDLRRGLIRLPARVQGRPVSLLWTAGHGIEHLWPELGE